MSDLFSSGIRPSVDAWLLAKSKEKRDYGQYWSASSAGYCMRRVIFERLGVPKIASDSDARKTRVFESGKIFHAWIQGITKEAGLSIAQELELQDEDLMIRGHIDDLVLIQAEVTQDEFHHVDLVNSYGSTNPKDHDKAAEIENRPDKLILYDYKTVNSRAFLWAKKNGNAMSHYHKLQLGTYMYMLRKGAAVPQEDDDFYTKAEVSELSEGRICKLEKDTLMMSEQQLMWTPDLEKEVVGYWSTLNGYWKAKKIPNCTCHIHEGGFLAREAYNPFFYEGKPCSSAWVKKCKEEGVKLSW